MERVYQCAACRREFTAENSDDDAQREAVETWGMSPRDVPMDIVCDACYREILQWATDKE
jgi:DNA-directed RNA polymerase subunit RPC12/RpoP